MVLMMLSDPTQFGDWGIPFLIRPLEVEVGYLHRTTTERLSGCHLATEQDRDEPYLCTNICLCRCHLFLGKGFRWARTILMKIGGMVKNKSLTIENNLSPQIDDHGCTL